MRFFSRLTGALRAMVFRRHVDAELDDELRDYLAAAVEANIAAGLSREDAIRRARADMGSPAAVKEWVRDVGWESRIESLWQDVRYAGRRLRRSPGFTAAAVLTLALGVGATTAVFSVVYAVVIRPLPFPNADRLVQIVQVLEPTVRSPEPLRAGLTPNQFADLQEHTGTLAVVGGYSPAARTLTGIDTPMRLSGAGVTPGLFSGLGVPAALGRLFVPEDAARGADPVVILNYQTWTTYFGRDRAIIDRRIPLGDLQYRVVGVMPQSFGFPSLAGNSMSRNSAGELADAPEFWFPLSPYERLPDGVGGFSLFQAFAMLREGVTQAEALADIRTVLSPLPQNRQATLEIVSAADEMAEGIRDVLVLFQLGVALILLIAAVNVVNLLLTRAAHRRREHAVCVALGASRVRLVREALAESVLLALAGGALGCGLAYAGVAALQQLPPHLLPRLSEVRVDRAVLIFALSLSLATGLIVGLLSAFRVARGNARSPLSPVLRGVTVSPPRGMKPSGTLVVVEIAATMILLTGSALLITSFSRLMQVDPGFGTDGTLTFRVPLTGGRYANSPGAQQDLVQRVLDAIRGMPGVVDAAAGSSAIDSGPIGLSPSVNGRRMDGNVLFRTVTPGYFRTLGVPMRVGREFAAADHTSVAGRAVVNEAFVRRYLRGTNPIGADISYREWTSLQIVGVVPDTKIRLDAESGPAMYLPPDDRAAFNLPTLVVRSNAEPSALVPAIRQAVSRIDPRLPVFDAMTVDEMIAHTSASPRLYRLVSLWCAIIALVLAATGLYGVLAYSVKARTQEFGIRMALGADAGRVYGDVMRKGLALTLAGVVPGVAGSYYGARFLESLLFGVTPRDPATLIAATVTLAAVAALACFIPARKATRVDAIVALRTE
jgi:putative ABC transport system permease protein